MQKSVALSGDQLRLVESLKRNFSKKHQLYAASLNTLQESRQRALFPDSMEEESLSEANTQPSTVSFRVLGQL